MRVSSPPNGWSCAIGLSARRDLSRIPSHPHMHKSSAQHQNIPDAFETQNFNPKRISNSTPSITIDTVAPFSPSHSLLSCPCLDTLFDDTPPFRANIDKTMVVMFSIYASLSTIYICSLPVFGVRIPCSLVYLAAHSTL